MRFSALLLCGLLGLFSPPPYAQTPDQAMPALQPSDVRLLIDVSGSMKNTDPKNLRKPAYELLVRLLPNDSRAGVWTFGIRVQQMMHHQPVDSGWRSQALTQGDRIVSTDLYTYIGAALERAAFDLEAGVSHKRSIILLTDGVVDIGKDADENARERERILQDLLPRLQSAGYTLHTIALSEQADHDLMERLAKATDGVYASVMSADELMGVFLRIFDQAVPQERLPLEKNRFLVDESIEEFTVLVFRKPGSSATALKSPAGDIYTHSLPAHGVSWHSSAHYDLITVTGPRPGEWSLEAELDPDNRVTLVSNLRLVVTPPKNNIEVSQTLDLHFLLQEDEKPLVDPQFLQILNIDVIVTRDSDGRQWQLPIANTVPPIDGVYAQPLELFRETGHYRVQLRIDGKTFKREYQHQVTVGSPFKVTMERVLHQNRVAYRLEIHADDARVDVEKTAVVATLRDSLGGSALRQFDFIPDKAYWQLVIVPEVAARYSVGLQVSGHRTDATPIRETLASRYFVYPDKDDPLPDHPVNDGQAASSDTPPPVESTDGTLDEPVPEEAAAAATSSSGFKKIMLYASIGLANLIVLVLAFFAYRLIMGKKAREESAAIEETLNEDIRQSADPRKPAMPMQDLNDAGKPASPSTAVDVADDHAAEKISLGSAGSNDEMSSSAPDEELSELDAFLSDADFDEKDDTEKR